VLLLVLVEAALAAWAMYVPIGPAAGTPTMAATYVDIAPGTGTEAIAAQLEEAGSAAQPLRLRPAARVKGGKLIAGEYRFNQPATASEVYARMVRGDVYSIPVTIPEGYNIFEIAQAVEAAGLGPRALCWPPNAARPRRSPTSRPAPPRWRVICSRTPTASAGTPRRSRWSRPW